MVSSQMEAKSHHAYGRNGRGVRSVVGPALRLRCQDGPRILHVSRQGQGGTPIGCHYSVNKEIVKKFS
jgi:hypothetical protein